MWLTSAVAVNSLNELLGLIAQRESSALTRRGSQVRSLLGPLCYSSLPVLACIAQLVEQRSCKPQVMGSSPIAGSIFEV